MANIKELIQSIESGDSSFDEKLAAINQMEETLVAMKEQEAIDDNVELIIEALRTIEAKVEAKLRIIPEKGEQGIQGAKGEQGDRGLDGAQGKDGKSGADGKDGLDGKDGVSVQDAKIDFDGSLVITLSDGKEINVGEVVPVDVAEKIRTVHNIQSGSGGDSQTVLDAIAALQATIATYGTMATQNANAVAITGGTINNTTVGAITPSTGVFTTLTATGQTSLGGVADSESLRVLVPGTAGGAYETVQAGSNFIEHRFGGSQSNISLRTITRGTGSINFYTNNSASNLQLAVTNTASAVNYHQLTGSATGSGPIHSVAGSDTNIDNNLSSKGSGVLNLNTGAGTQVRIIDSGGTAVNRIHLQGQGTGFLPVIASRGSDTNLGMSYSTQGTGGHDFYTAGTNFTQQVKIAHTASAVNYVQVTGATTGNSPALTLQGSDANVAGVISTKGTGGFSFYTNNVNQRQLRIIHTASSVNFFDVTGGATGFGAVLSAAGSDTNIPAVLQPKGTGALQAQQTDSTATGGNARGANAVDWQTSRSAASQVASGSQTLIAGGNSNTAAAFGSAVVGGSNNSITGGAYNAILGGIGNTTGSSGQGITMGGGHANSALGFFNFVGGGFTNSGTSGSTVTTQSATMNGTTAVTLSGSNASIKVGQLISGTSIATYPHTYVAAISGTSLTLSQAASGSSTSTLSFFTPHGVVVGGGNNQATGSYSFIGGGGDAGTAANRNVASGDWSFVGGGTKNIASGLYSSVNGSNNTASGTASVVAGGGAFGAQGFLGNQASGTSAFVGAGLGNLANSSYSVVVAGTFGTTRGIDANHVFPAINNAFGANATGVAQSALLVLAKQTTDATATVLVSNSSAAGTTNQVILPNNSAYFFTGEVVAGVTGGGNTKGWTIEGVIKRGANAASTALVGTPTVTSTYADAGASTWVIAVTADTTNGGLAVTFTGQAGTTIRTVCRVNTTEMTF